MTTLTTPLPNGTRLVTVPEDGETEFEHARRHRDAWRIETGWVPKTSFLRALVGRADA